MPVDLTMLVEDLKAETAELRHVLVPLDERGWKTPTPAPGWRVQEQVAHLAYFDEAATTAATDADQFQRELDEAVRDADGITERISRRSRTMQPVEVLAWFDSARRTMIETMLSLDPSARVPWYGPPMSVASSLTARIMETWAHGQDVFDALELVHPPSRALRQVSHLGVQTFTNSFVSHGLDVPDVSVFVDLTGPDGSVWTWGDPTSDERISGYALDFALVVTQRRHVDDTNLKIHGPVAAEWMSIAQAFAGPPGEGRSPTKP